MRITALSVLFAVCLVACGSSRPKADPGVFATHVVRQIVHNQYSHVWADMHPVDQKVAPFAEYISCENRSPVIAVPRTIKVLLIDDESIGLGNGKFVDSKAVHVKLGFAGGFNVTHTVHLVASGGKWKWILPSWRFRDYKADRCPTDAASTPEPSAS